MKALKEGAKGKQICVKVFIIQFRYSRISQTLSCVNPVDRLHKHPRQKASRTVVSTTRNNILHEIIFVPCPVFVPFCDSFYRCSMVQGLDFNLAGITAQAICVALSMPLTKSKPEFKETQFITLGTPSLDALKSSLQ